jgi:hypothetical protein
MGANNSSGIARLVDLTDDQLLVVNKWKNCTQRLRVLVLLSL